MLQVRVFGVGDGDCILITLPSGRVCLIDSCTVAGNQDSPALPFIAGKEVAFCCLTHPHGDHVRGMRRMLESAKRVEQFWYALSDLDEVVNEWKNITPRVNQVDPRRGEHAELTLVFDWVFSQTSAPERQCFGVQPVREFDGVEFFVFGPNPDRSRRYKENLKERLKSGLFPDRRYANHLSIAMLVRYGKHLIWLLGDLPAPGLRELSMRETKDNVKTDSARGFKANVIKIAHHGSCDGWFPEIAETLTTCNPSDVIVFSASGGRQRPHPEVLNYWSRSGKQISLTYTTSEVSGNEGFRPVKRKLLSQRTRSRRPPQNLLLNIPPGGDVRLETF